MKKKVSGKAKLFSEELNKSIQKISSQYGYHVPDFNIIEHDNNLYVNLSCYKNNPLEEYKKNYLLHYDKLGLRKEWLNSYFVTPDSKRKMKILGIDIDGGDNFIRTRDENEKDFFFDSDSIIFLVTNNATI
jgi:hypothetical protein